VKQPEKFIGKIYFDSFSPPLVHHEYAGKIIRTEKHENFFPNRRDHPFETQGGLSYRKQNRLLTH
jgi:hypothetical protein